MVSPGCARRASNSTANSPSSPYCELTAHGRLCRALPTRVIPPCLSLRNYPDATFKLGKSCRVRRALRAPAGGANRARVFRFCEVAGCCANGGDGRGDAVPDRLLFIPRDSNDDAANGPVVHGPHGG